jgi:hypothetical protein
VDDGVREGDAISPFYDSMMAKLIVHGDTREQALARLDAALAQTHIVGLQTNVQFLRHVVRSPSFAKANWTPPDPARAGRAVPTGAGGPAAGVRPCGGAGAAGERASQGRSVQPPRRLAFARADGAPL